MGRVLLHIFHFYTVNFMKEIFQEYGSVLITVVAILSVILVVSAIIGHDTTSPIAQAFTGLINHFVDQANVNGGIPSSVVQ